MNLSIITPSYNQANFINETIESVRTQTTDFTYEHIIIDGGSTDGTLNILKKCSGNLKYISEKDSGQSNAINKGINIAKGEIVCWLNSDDLLIPGAIEKIITFFNKNPDKEWVCGRCININQYGKPDRNFIAHYKNFLLKRYSYHYLLIENYIAQPAVFFKKTLFEKTGKLDESLKYDMDYDLWLRFGLESDPGIINENLAAFRIYPQATTSANFSKSLKSAYMTSKKYAAKINKPWLAVLNYFFYYKRTQIIYRFLNKLKP